MPNLGPFKVSSACALWVEHVNRGTTVATVHFHGGDMEEGKATARLFAASADLLLALQVSTDNLAVANRETSWNFTDTILRNRALIAKAEGRNA